MTRLFSRRGFLARSSAVGVTAALAPRLAFGADGPARSRGAPVGTSELATRVDPAFVKQLAMRALDAAKAAGVSYADVRLTRTVQQTSGAGVQRMLLDDTETFAVGVRCMVNGRWGFAASPVWSPDEMTALARNAAKIAAANAKGGARPIDWQPIPVASGDWTMPIEIDPFTIPVEERIDAVLACEASIARYRQQGEGLLTQLSSNGSQCWRQERAVATSEGAYFTQTVYRTGALGGLRLTRGNEYWDAPFQRLTPTGRGWELVRDAKLEEQLPELVPQLEEIARTPVKATDLGRYELVMDGWSVGSVIDATLARATELDRALGYEANASGTSYLGPDPLTLLGQFEAASSAVTLTADRSMPGGLATVKWDDEGVLPESTTLVKDGVLVDYQTTREQAGWLAPYYQKAGRPVRSHGYAAAESALGVTMQHLPNFSLQPGKTPATLADMIAGVKKGIYVFWGNGTRTDFQAKTGTIGGGFMQREIVNGKLGAMIPFSHGIFNAVELWKSVAAVGSNAEARCVETSVRKGQPGQYMLHTTRAVPAHFKSISWVR